MFIVIIIVFLGCGKNDEKAVNNNDKKVVDAVNNEVDNTELENQKPAININKDTESHEGIDKSEEVAVKDNKIFFFGKERGFIEDEKINIKFDDGYINFSGDIEKIKPHVRI